MKKYFIYAVLCILIIALSIWGWKYYAKSMQAKIEYTTANLELGDITQMVTANGALNPVTVVNVGTQVSGIIEHIYVDFNQNVQAGQILARLNSDIFLTDIRDAKAQIIQINANLNLARVNLKRQQALFKEGATSRLSVDVALKDVQVQEAQLSSAQAKLQKMQTNLNNSIIKSPITGVIMQKNVDIGQTVAASFQTPTLFQIAKNLDDMEVHASIVEADIGKMRVDLPATFSVDAFENKVFQAKIKQIRINPIVNQNVVTYNVILSTKNDGTLLPGMTAQVRIIYAEKQNVFKVPLLALKFKPNNTNNYKNNDKNSHKDNWKNNDKNNGKDNTAPTQIYILENNQPKPILVEAGISDQKFIEITPLNGKVLTTNQKVIIKEVREEKLERSAITPKSNSVNMMRL
jgi:HlyD family secretion protein